ncbi:ubiquitin carboxyl-terminal hydrolase 25-like isoform X3 [Equus caballus]|uniref:ubiquitin carboxyl-terminal hydrolase 25-like isoform X3 n=1 Tax=Equus caballus TaxID=9796 RepID=UPI0038B3405E
MTVEQNVLQQSAAQKDSNGNLELAVAFLTAKNAKTPQQEETTYYQTVLPGSDRYISVGSQADANVIDLTGDDEDDLQRAIALSLAESNRAFRETGMTDEEQAVSRVLEASTAENKACLKRTPTEVWRDSRNPYDRKRQDKAPVGLKNVGNTCWFSAVIQSLFSLLEFRRLLLNYKPPSRSRFTPKPKGRQTLSYLLPILLFLLRNTGPELISVPIFLCFISGTPTTAWHAKQCHVHTWDPNR